MNEVELGLHLLSEHGLCVHSLGRQDQRIHAMLHHPSQTSEPDHEHARESVREEG